MPGHSNGYPSSSAYLKVTMLAFRGEPARARLCLAGEVDIAANDMLGVCVDWLITLAPLTVVIDLAEVTFAGSSLPNFVVRAADALSPDSDLILCGANPMTRWVLRVADVTDVATITDGPRRA